LDLTNSILRAAISGFVSIFGGAHPLVSLVPLSILLGLLMLWVFKISSNQKGIDRAKKKMQAYLLELRLYGDDPALIFKTQWHLITSNMRYLGLMFKPALILTIPMVLLLVHMDAIYGIAPLGAGESAVVTVQTTGSLSATTPAPTLTAPDIVAVDTPAVRAFGEGQFSWRVRGVGDGAGVLQFDWDGRRWTKDIVAGDALSYVSYMRTASFWETFLYAGESRIDTPDISSIQISYPAAEIQTGSLSLHWLVWFLLISIVSAYGLKGFFGVKV
jgi:uncharacterized membrane protein (DUF106 family)